MPQRLLALVLVLMMLISVLPVSAMAAELTPADAQTGLTATDVTNELTDSDRLSIFEENMDPSKVSKSDVPADDEMVRVIVQLDADSLLDARNRTNAGMSMLDFQQTAAAKAQLEEIADVQLSVMNAMESQSIPSSFTFSYTSAQRGRLLRRNGVPCPEVRIADTFFRIPLIRQNMPDSGKTQLSIGGSGSINGCLVPSVEKR